MSGDYNQQPDHVKTYRWVRYQVPAFISACINTLCWLLLGAPLIYYYKSRWECVKAIFEIERNTAHWRMGNYSLITEIIDELREKIDGRLERRLEGQIDADN